MPPKKREIDNGIFVSQIARDLYEFREECRATLDGLKSSNENDHAAFRGAFRSVYIGLGIVFAFMVIGVALILSKGAS
jgi:hypothetical protein